MKAAYYDGHQTISIGDSIPVEPGPGEVQIRVSHCGICGTDLHIFHGKMDRRVHMPQVIGHEMSGHIVTTGAGVAGFAAGDRVTVRPLDHCGTCPACAAGHSHICQRLKFIGIDSPGAFQGLWTVPAHTLHRLPDKVSFEQGALIEPLAVACHDVRLAGVRAGEYVVVQGGGPIGLLVALVAKNAGARVVISEISPFRLQLARELGLTTVNPLEADVVEFVNRETGEAGADVVFEVSAAAAGAELMTKLPRTRGRIVIVGIYGEPQKVDLFRFFWRELKLIGARVYEPEDFERSIELAASGSLPLGRIITKVLPLEELEAGFRLMESGGDVMKVLVECSGSQRRLE
jgi:(R,R)-butanediol dehydrogenase / meso-butanediol dehydrogenase / diacetyl reductase